MTIGQTIDLTDYYYNNETSIPIVLQMSRDALLEEVSYLSANNAKLNEQLRDLPALKEKMIAMKHRIDVLLVMLGEKEEELEATVADMKEVKHLYRGQLDDLLLKVAPPPSSSSSSSSSSSIDIRDGEVDVTKVAAAHS